jgi:glucosamine--fructose-6-phosphate aminotransferase (isomerizing)
MCGIVAYVGGENPMELVFEGLQRLEYRGYDSAGIFLSNQKETELIKVAGKVSNLREAFKNKKIIDPTIGIGHTRWATHGEPNEINAHPHKSNSGELILVHNGIVENSEVLRKELIEKGYNFYSKTDSEVLVNLIEDAQKDKGLSLEAAVKISLNRIIGAYGIVIFDLKNPTQIIAAKLGSPIVIGIGEKDFFVSSDASAFIEHTKDVIYLEDYQMITLSKNRQLKLLNITNDKVVDPLVDRLKWNLENIQKQGYEYFMLKEINEQPDAIKNTLRGRLISNTGIKISSIDENEKKFLNAKRIIIVACGTSWHAGLVGEYLIESIAKIPVEVEYASEFRYRDPLVFQDDIVIPISQSGETADTLAAINIAKNKNPFIYGICNVVGSSISRQTDSGIYTHAGPEIGVASTKAFTTQITILILLALKISEIKGNISKSDLISLLVELKSLPDKIKNFLKKESRIIGIAEKIYNSTNALYLGRGLNFPVALEGALKLKEISYIHAEGYPAAEMKHGPIALIDKEMPVIVIATKKGHYEKIVSNIQEIKSRKGKIISIITQGDEIVKELSDYYIEIPESTEYFSPLFSTIPLQLLAYHIAVLRKCNVDMPRNLAKSVTVE